MTGLLLRIGGVGDGRTHTGLLAGTARVTSGPITLIAGDLVDAYGGQLIVPVLRAGGIKGFIGRDTTGDPHAPNYRDATRTPASDKSTSLNSPTDPGLDSDANVEVVEGERRPSDPAVRL